VEEASYDFEHFILVAFDVATECFVVVRAKFVDDAVDHCRTKHIVLFEDSTLAFEAVGRCGTTVGKLSQ